MNAERIQSDGLPISVPVPVAGRRGAAIARSAFSFLNEFQTPAARERRRGWDQSHKFPNAGGNEQ
jgi:hypothetical protein